MVEGALALPGFLDMVRDDDMMIEMLVFCSMAQCQELCSFLLFNMFVFAFGYGFNRMPMHG